MDVESIKTLRKALVAVGRRIYDKGFVAANDGNISVRVDESRILISPTGVSKGFMKPESMVVTDMQGNPLRGEGKPSSEVRLHLTVYKERPDISAVCHAHPVTATAFASAGIPLDRPILPEVIISIGAIPLVPYGTPGTDELADPLLEFLPNHDAFLLSHHGALTLGKDIWTAYHRMETLEHFALILHAAMSLGPVPSLKQNEVQALLSQRKKWGIRSDLGPYPKS